MIDHERYRDALTIAGPMLQTADGGQELLLGEIAGVLPPPPACVWLPFYGPTLRRVLTALGYEVFTLATSQYPDAYRARPLGLRIDAVYFGTPTVVDGRALFPLSTREEWTAAKERAVVRDIVRDAIVAGAQTLVSGLGTGDVSVGERRHDMGEGTAVAVAKQFVGFRDYVLVRSLSPASSRP